MYLHRGVAPAPELERGCEDRVEVAPAGREGGAHHRGRDEAVDGSRIPSKNAELYASNLIWTTCILGSTRWKLIREAACYYC